MIKRLRLKFVLINMSIVSIMLVVLLGLVFYFTSANLERESMRMLENIALQPVGLGVPGQPGEDVQLPFFKLQLGLGGQVVATGGGYYDLSDQALLDQLIARTSASPKSLGVRAQDPPDRHHDQRPDASGRGDRQRRPAAVFVQHPHHVPADEGAY